MRRSLAAASMLAVCSSALHAADGDTARTFKPASAWQADFGDDYCRLARSFSDGKNTLSLAFERVQPTNSLRMIVVGSGFKVFRSADKLTLALAPSGGERSQPFWRSETADGQQYFNLGEVIMGGAPAAAAPPPPYDRAAEQAFAGGVTALEITAGLTEPVRIETGALKAPLSVLQQCADDLLTVWGLDAEKHKSMTRAVQPSGDTSKWLATGIIGFKDFGKLGGAANQIRIIVGADGKPTSCAVHWASLEQKTNDAICKGVMEKGSFIPAVDVAGQPMASLWTVPPAAFMPPFGGT